MQSVHKYGKPAFVAYPEVVDIIGLLHNAELGMQRFTNIRHFKFALDVEGDDSVKMTWKPTSASVQWEGGMTFFPLGDGGEEAKVNISSLNAVTRFSSRMMVRGLCICNV